MLLSDASHPTSPPIFVSSTVREFRDIRSAIAYTLRAQGFIVCLAEAADFDVRGDCSVIEECLENIRKCDYYILFISGMRGNLAGVTGLLRQQSYLAMTVGAGGCFVAGASGKDEGYSRGQAQTLRVVLWSAAFGSHYSIYPLLLPIVVCWVILRRGGE